MTIDTAFWLFYWLVMANLFIGVPALFLMSFCLPNALRQQYYRPPYFKANELALLGWFPLSVFNDVALASMFVWPRLGRKRGVVAAGGELPTWYQLVLRAYFWGTSLSLLLALVAGGWVLVNSDHIAV